MRGATFATSSNMHCRCLLRRLERGLRLAKSAGRFSPLHRSQSIQTYRHQLELLLDCP
jgi:hypothetical protein